jgi:hypothetical protein
MDFDPIYVAGIQKTINEKASQRLVCDGQFGPKSVAALKVYQALNNLPENGDYDDQTQSLIEPFLKQKFLTFDSITKAAVDLGVSKAHIRTVCDVESQGAGFLPDGRVKILFERHHFLASLKTRLPAEKITALMKLNSDIINAEAGGYLGNEAEYKRFIRACAIDQYSAYYATSFGLFQIMGFNYQAAGYTDLTSFFKAMQASETNQLMAFVNFNKVYRRGVLWNALRNRDWINYALNYNGSAYQKNNYDKKLASSYAKYDNDIFAY